MAQSSDPHDVDLSEGMAKGVEWGWRAATPQALREFNIALPRVHRGVLFLLNPLGKPTQPVNVCESNATVLRFDGTERKCDAIQPSWQMIRWKTVGLRDSPVENDGKEGKSYIEVNKREIWNRRSAKTWLFNAILLWGKNEITRENHY